MGTKPVNATPATRRARPATALVVVLVLVLAVLSGCSEYELSRGIPNGLDSASVFLFSNPSSTAQVMSVEDAGLELVSEVETPRTLTLPTGDYVVHFARQGYEDHLEGVLLGPGSYKEVSVTLDSLSGSGGEPNGEPPSVSITVTPDEIQLGETVEVTVETDGDVGVLLPINIFTTEGTYTDSPERAGTVIYSFAAFRDGLWAAAADSVFVRPAPPVDPENGQVLAFSNPPSNVEVYNITRDGELVSAGQIERTPFVFELTPGPFAFAFRETGYVDAMRGVLLGPGQVKEINVDLIPIGSPTLPPTVELTVEPRVVDPGTPVTFTIRTTGADYSLFIGQETAASAESEWTWTSTPEHTHVSTAIAIGDGGVATDTTTVVVLTEPGEDCTPIQLSPTRGVTTGIPRVLLHPDPIHIPEHAGPVRIRILNMYSADVPGQEDEAYAVGLQRGDDIEWALRQGDSCPVVPDPGYEVETTVWVESEITVGPGDYEVVMWHASTGEFSCYEPNGDLRGPDSVNVQNAEVIFCR
jgi:hypothetical protein